MVGVVPELENEMKDELLRVDNVYKCAGKDMTQFPTFHLSGNVDVCPSYSVVTND